jgi:hypothetical protein
LAHVAAFSTVDGVRRLAGRAAGVFWNADIPNGSERLGREPGFTEWFIQDYTAPKRTGPLLWEFADQTPPLSVQEEQLLLALLVTPLRAFEVTETRGALGVVVKDLLTGADGILSPLGLPEGLIRSDLCVARMLPVGRLQRTGISCLRLPPDSRGELLAYLRAAYRVSRPGRHLSLEDHVDSAAHLYHHFFLERGRELGGRVHRTCRWRPFVSCHVQYRGYEMAQIRAALARQSALEQVGDGEEGTRYVWLDQACAVASGTVLLQQDEVHAQAHTEDDMARLTAFLETCLRGLVQRVATGAAAAVTEIPATAPRPAGEAAGTAFIRRFLARWVDTPSPLLGDQTPRIACQSPAGRDRVTQVLLKLERDLARQKRLGRAWADVGPLWEQLGLAPVALPRGPGHRTERPVPKPRAGPRAPRR